jgi:amino acid transporter
MTFVRLIGRWAMTALVINCIIGGGIFGLPGELTRLLGRASPFAMILAALGMAVILACFAEVASQFSEPGGAYLYVRTAFGRFAGMQISWFDSLNMIATVGMVWFVAASTIPRAVPSSKEFWTMQCEADCDSQNLEGGVRAQIPSGCEHYLPYDHEPTQTSESPAQYDVFGSI